MEQNTEQPKRKQRWYKIVLKIFLWIIGSVVGLVLLAWLLLIIFQNKIEQKVISRVNEELNSEIKVKDVDVSLFHHFPLVSVVLRDVTAADATPQKAGNLLTAEWVSLEFDIIDLFTGDYTIRQIGMDKGVVLLKVFKDGTDNFHILKPQSGSSTGEKTVFHIEKLYVTDVAAGYTDQRYNQKYSFYLHKAKAAGSFYDAEFNMNFSASLRVDSLRTADMSFIPGTEGTIQSVLTVNSTTETVTFNDAEIFIKDVLLLADGRVDYNPKKELVDITVSSDRTDLNEFFSLLPEDAADFLDEFEHSGIISIQSHVKGCYSDGKLPAVDVSVKMKDGYIRRAENDLTLSNICFDGQFTAADFGKESTYSLSVKDFKAVFDQKTISGSVQVKSFNRPRIKLQTKGDVALDKIQEWGQWDDIKTLSGNLHFDFQFAGTLRDFSGFEAKDFIESKSSGSLLIEDARLLTKEMNNTAEVKKIDATFSNRDLKIESMDVKYGSSDFSGSGYLKEILPFIFSDSADLNLKADLHSNTLNIADLFSDDQPSSSPGSGEIRFALPDHVLAIVDYSVDKLSYNKFGASHVKAAVQLSSNKLLADHVSMKTLGGSISGSGYCDTRLKDKIKVSVDADLKNIDVREAFIVFNNFGQEDMTYDNLRGKADVSLQMKTTFSEKLEFDPASVVVNADIEINDGQLVGYAPLNDLQTIIKDRDFSDIRFEKLASTISIKDSKINIPKTEIRSNVMNLKVTGTHSFDNEIEYHLEVKFSDIKKQKTQTGPENEYGYVVDDGVGDPTIFILITGTVENPQYKQLDKKAMQEKVKQDLKQEKQNLKQILKDEFGVFKNDTTLKKVEEPPKENVKFQIEWEEE